MRNVRRKSPGGLRRVWLMASAAVVAWPGVGHAQSVDIITVTAQKREETLQDVPLAISVVGEKKLDALGADSFSDYARTVPGLSFIDAGPAGGRGNAGGAARQISIRGISSDAGTDVVGFYLNETPITFSDPRVFDVERIEVLRGPQGTLYGSGSVAGTVRILTKGPDPDAFDAKASAYLSGTEHGGLNAGGNLAVNLPLSGNAAIRVNGYYLNDSGYIDNSLTGEEGVNDSEVSGVRATLMWQPTNALEITPMFWYQKAKAGAPPNYTANTGDLLIPLQADSSQEESMRFGSLSIKYDFGFAELVSASAYYDLDSVVFDDVTGLIHGLFGVVDEVPTTTFENSIPTEQFVQEVRLASSDESPVRWIIGGFFSDRESRFDQLFTAPGFDDATGIDVDDLMFFGDVLLTQQQFAAFGEISYDVVDSLTATFGMRYFNVETTDDRTQRGLFVGAPVIDEVSGGSSASDSGIAPKASLSYSITDDQTVYATVARGFRPGGPVRQIPTFLCGADLTAFGFDPANPPQQYEADKLWSYEVGGKTAWMDNRLVVNGAAYYIDWQAAQQTVNLPCLFPFTFNTNDASSLGGEVEVNFAVTEALRVDVSVGYTDAKLDEDASALNAVKGESLLFVPKWTYAIGAEYSTPIGSDLEGSFRADWQYVGKRFDNFAANTLVPGTTNTLSSYGVLNLQARLGAEKWTVAVFAENVTDERAEFNRPITPSLDGSNIGTNRPRTIGLRLTGRY